MLNLPVSRPLPAALAAALLLTVALTAAATAQPPAGSDDARWLEGRGEHEMVLIHGLGANATVWQDVEPYLAGAFSLHVYELHGHGDTPPLRDPSLDAEVAALRRWIEDRGLVYPVLVGHGLGGMIAMQYAFEHPAEVQRLVVIDTAPKQLADQEQKTAVAEALLHDYDRFVASRFLDISPDQSVNERAVDMALRTDSATFASLLLSSFDWDLTAQLPRQSVPMLVIGSQLFLPEAGYERDYLEQYGYGAARVLNFKRMEYTGHYVMLEKPTMLASIITVWVRQQELKN